MRIIAAVMVVVLLLGTASAAEIEKPPVLTLERDGIVVTPVTGNYSWSYPTGKNDEWSAVEA